MQLVKLTAVVALALLSLLFLLARGRARSSSQALARLERGSRSAQQGHDDRSVLHRALRAARSRGNKRPDSRMKSAFAQSGLTFDWKWFRLIRLALLLALPPVAYAVTGSVLAIPAAVLASQLIPLPLLRALARRSRGKTSEQAERFATDLSLYLRCGVPLADAVKLCARDGGPSLAPFLSRFEQRVALGGGPSSALGELADALGNPDLQLIAQAVGASRETGSDIRTIMAAVGEALRERAAIRRELESQTVQGRLSGMIVTALPFLFLGLSLLVSRGTVSMLFNSTTGLIMLGGAALLDLLGFFWIRRILDVKT